MRCANAAVVNRLAAAISSLANADALGCVWVSLAGAPLQNETVSKLDILLHGSQAVKYIFCTYVLFTKKKSTKNWRYAIHYRISRIKLVPLTNEEAEINRAVRPAACNKHTEADEIMIMITTHLSRFQHTMGQTEWASTRNGENTFHSNTLWSRCER